MSSEGIHSPVGLPLQPGLEHRGAPGSRQESLFPPPGAFAAVGGREGVAALVDGLYDRIEADALLRPAFGRDLTHEREKQKRFFAEWLGGAAGYFQSEWPPGLRAAHGAVSISRGMAERWLAHFLASLAAAARDPAAVEQIRPAVSRLARGLVNRPDEPLPGERLRCSSTGADLEAFLRSQDTTAATLREGPRLLLLAAVRGKFGAAEELLRRGVDPNTPALLPGSDRRIHGLPLLPLTPLCGALARRKTKVVELLMQHDAQYDVFTAACVGDLEAVGKLLDLAPELVNACDPASDVARITPLLHAVFPGQGPVAQLLLERGATVGENSVRLIRAAANRGDAGLTELLLAHGADPSPLGPGDWVLYRPIADQLLARGANVNQGPERSWISTCCTGNSGHPENAALARAYLRCGADVTTRYGGNTALHCAARAGFARVAEALIEYGADVNALTDRGLTPLDVLPTAGKSVDLEPVRRLLIAHGARRGLR